MKNKGLDIKDYHRLLSERERERCKILFQYIHPVTDKSTAVCRLSKLHVNNKIGA